MQLKTIQALVDKQLKSLNQEILGTLNSQVPLINEIGDYIIKSGGKRLRPLITLLCGQLCQTPEKKTVEAANAIELIHTATLLHDDVIDKSNLRRNRVTVNEQWDNAPAVLVGDFLYSKVFQIMANIQNLEAIQLIANTTNTIAEGEVMQIMHQQNPKTSVESYFTLIELKTAVLFAAAAKIPAVLSNQEKTVQEALNTYGFNLGIAFQLIDDVLDYHQDAKTMGKNTGDDLAEGKPTLPLIHCLQQAASEEKELIETALRNNDKSQLKPIQDLMKKYNSLEYTIEQAKQFSEKAIMAIQDLPTNTYWEALVGLAAFSVNRDF